MGLEKYKDEIAFCCKCGGCRIGSEHAIGMPICPTGERWQYDSYYAAGRFENAKVLLEGGLEWTDRLIDRYFTCLKCGACEEHCYEEVGLHPVKVIEEVEKELVKRGIGPHPKQHYKNHTRFFERYGERLKKAAKEMGKSAETMYFLGCTLECYDKEISDVTEKIIQASAQSFVVSGRDWCCGYPLLHTGQIEQAKGIVEDNVNTIEGLGVRKVVFNCPHCYRIFKFEYPEILGKKLNFEAAHTTVHFSKLIESGELEPKYPISMRVTYHDPCLIGRRGGKIYNPPREILHTIPGIKLAEMDRRKGETWCCGAGSRVRVAYPDFAKWTATQRLKEVESLGVNTLISACPICKINFTDAMKAEGKNIKILDVNQVLAESLGIK
nr:(Fe-S)-binding protein [Candidatus Njordarchaeota archaeon]